MVDAAYQQLYEFLRPGVRENECVGLVSKVLYDLGSEFVEGVNAISGERCSPHPHVYSDRLIRGPVTRRSLTSCTATSAIGPATTGRSRSGARPVRSADAYVRCREYMDQAIAMVRPGVTTGDIVSSGRGRRNSASRTRPAAFALQYGHGVGLSIWEKPIFSRLVSLDYPELAGGRHGVRTGNLLACGRWLVGRQDRGRGRGHCRRLRGHHEVPGRGTAGRRPKYWTAGGALDTLRESQSNLNTAAGRGDDPPNPPADAGRGETGGDTS